MSSPRFVIECKYNELVLYSCESNKDLGQKILSMIDKSSFLCQYLKGSSFVTRNTDLLASRPRYLNRPAVAFRFKRRRMRNVSGQHDGLERESWSLGTGGVV